MTLCYARLAGPHLSLASAELEAILEAEGLDARLLSVHALVAFLDCRESPARVAEALIGRAGFTRSVGVLLGVYEDPGALAAGAPGIARALGGAGVVRVEAHRMLGLWRDAEPERDASRLAAALEALGLPVSPRGGRVVEILYIEGFVAAGLVLARLDTKAFLARSPGRRPFFKPGPLDPFLSRVLVNLSRLRRGGVFWDPFCGTGGIALEACLIGASRVLCGDLDPLMARGSRVNLEHYGCSERSLCHMADAASPPVVPGSVDAIATDPPYGRSTSLGGRSRELLYRGFLGEAYARLRPGSYIAFAAPSSLDAGSIASDAGFDVVGRYYMYVHGSLTREIIVARKV